MNNLLVKDNYTIEIENNFKLNNNENTTLKFMGLTKAVIRRKYKDVNASIRKQQGLKQCVKLSPQETGN